MSDDDKKIIDYVLKKLNETQDEMKRDIKDIKSTVSEILVGHKENETNIDWLKTGFVSVGSITLAALFNSLFQFVTFKHKG